MTDPTPVPAIAMSDTDYRILARFRFALRVFLRFSEEAARAAGMTPAQHQLLLAVRGFPDGPPTISDLAHWLQLRHHSTVELIDRAVEADLLVRHGDQVDRRRQRLVLTDRGEQVLASLSAAHKEELRRFRTEMADVLAELQEQ
ncbi:MAG TPA: MarR family winged helix-turn-helix transcriptional regulator [Acidimicrobiales bacterium]|jgi:DNA-binding MarR family transcriptional regulator